MTSFSSACWRWRKSAPESRACVRATPDRPPGWSVGCGRLKPTSVSVRYLGDTMIAAVTAKQVSDWLRGLNVGPVTRNSNRRRLAALFSFTWRNGYVTTNPLPDVERASERECEIEILTVSETARLL